MGFLVDCWSLYIRRYRNSIKLTLRMLCHIFTFPLSAACLPSYVPSVVSLIHCMSHEFTYSVLEFSDILLIPINETDVFCQVLFGGFNYH